MTASSAELKAFLVTTPFFGGLSDASLDFLISMLVERRFDLGASIVAEGEPGRSMYIVHSGELVVSRIAESGRVIRMTRLGPGDFFGEMTLISPPKRSLDGYRIGRQHVTDVRIRIRANVAATNVVYAVRVR